MSKFEDVLQNSCFDYSRDGEVYWLSCYTPAGEDWEFYVTDEDDFKQYAKNFDPEEEFTLWVEAKNTVSGVPDIPTLWKDQLWKQKTLKALAKKL